LEDVEGHGYIYFSGADLYEDGGIFEEGTGKKWKRQKVFSLPPPVLLLILYDILMNIQSYPNHSGMLCGLVWLREKFQGYEVVES
jgi:hypothetical protein